MKLLQFKVFRVQKMKICYDKYSLFVGCLPILYRWNIFCIIRSSYIHFHLVFMCSNFRISFWCFSFVQWHKIGFTFTFLYLWFMASKNIQSPNQLVLFWKCKSINVNLFVRVSSLLYCPLSPKHSKPIGKMGTRKILFVITNSRNK